MSLLSLAVATCCLAWRFGPAQLVQYSSARLERHEFTNVNGKYPNYQKVGKITRMCVQFVPGSSFLRAAHTKSLGTRLVLSHDLVKEQVTQVSSKYNLNDVLQCLQYIKYSYIDVTEAKKLYTRKLAHVSMAST